MRWEQSLSQIHGYQKGCFLRDVSAKKLETNTEEEFCPRGSQKGQKLDQWDTPQSSVKPVWLMLQMEEISFDDYE